MVTDSFRIFDVALGSIDVPYGMPLWLLFSSYITRKAALKVPP